MGSVARQSPEFLAQKLRKIRKSIDGGLSQVELISHLGLTGEIDRTYISRYEIGNLEPPLRVLLRYAELANVHLEVLADDHLLLPDRLPCVPKSVGIKRKVQSSK